MFGSWASVLTSTLNPFAAFAVQSPCGGMALARSIPTSLSPSLVPECPRASWRFHALWKPTHTEWHTEWRTKTQCDRRKETETVALYRNELCRSVDLCRLTMVNHDVRWPKLQKNGIEISIDPSPRAVHSVFWLVLGAPDKTRKLWTRLKLIIAHGFKIFKLVTIGDNKAAQSKRIGASDVSCACFKRLWSSSSWYMQQGSAKHGKAEGDAMWCAQKNNGTLRAASSISPCQTELFQFNLIQFG